MSNNIGLFTHDKKHFWRIGFGLFGNSLEKYDVIREDKDSIIFEKSEESQKNTRIYKSYPEALGALIKELEKDDE